ncbi:MAG: flap endonuclease [Acidimicrobiia bacterium]|nr:flap endonuclease [Acidimicrobiia bacterium]
MQVHLVDGTYELFRHHFALPSRVNADGLEIAATRGVLMSMLTLLEEGATHVAIATDRTVESFRNELWDGYKSGEELDPELGEQFPVLDEVLAAAGFTVLSMIEHEADDGLASAAAMAAADGSVERVLICTPDKDLAQCVVDRRVVQFDRRKGQVFDHDGVIERFGVPPASIPDYLALMGDSADGFPGLPGWGAKSASTVLARYGHIEDIPVDPAEWDVAVRGAAKLAATLDQQRELALLFRRIATVVTDAPTVDSVAQLRWTGPADDIAQALERIDGRRLAERIDRLAAART